MIIFIFLDYLLEGQKHTIAVTTNNTYIYMHELSNRVLEKLLNSSGSREILHVLL